MPVPHSSTDTAVDIKLSPAARGRRLRSVRDMANLTRRYIAKKYHISASTLQAWEEGKSGGLTLKGAQRIILALRGEKVNCTVEWLLKGVGQLPYLSDVVYTGVKGNEAHEASNPVVLSNTDILGKELAVFREFNVHAADMTIIDDGMFPFYSKGDLVAGKKLLLEEIARAIDKDCIVETRNGEVLCRRLRKGRKKGTYHLQCTNLETQVENPFLYDVELLFAAPIIWHRKPV